MANSADQKPTALDLHCLQKQEISGFSRIRLNYGAAACIPKSNGIAKGFVLDLGT